MGTVANLIILIPLIIATASWQMKRTYTAEVKQMLPQPGSANNTILTQQMLTPLPPVVHRLRRSGVVGRENIQQISLQQTGEMTTKQNGSLIPFTAEQYFTTDKPSFNWRTTIRPSPVLRMTGRDNMKMAKAICSSRLTACSPLLMQREKKLTRDQCSGTPAEICWFLPQH
jgi:hypothetical protein